MSLRDYDAKRSFDNTPEPAGSAPARRGKRPIFVVQLHRATARHYDFRLEADGALKSWAVPRGPSLRVGEKRLAVQVEDHPISYAGFEGEIPEGNYGAGHVRVFDHGFWSCEGDPLEAIAAGKVEFTLHGDKLKGAWKLIRTRMHGGRGGGKPQWLLLKRDDAYAADLEADDLVEDEPAVRITKSSKQAAVSSAAKATTAKAAKTAKTAKTAKVAKVAASSKVAKSAGDSRGNATTTATSPSKSPRRAKTDWHVRAMALAGAIDTALPAPFKPELATLRETAPAGDDWLHEAKWDGYRLLVDVADGVVKLRSRNGLDWTADLPEVTQAIAALPVDEAHFDGELVVLDDKGVSDFAALQRALNGTAVAPMRYVVFDLPGVAGVDLSQAALLDRKTLLEDLCGHDKSGVLLYSAHVVGHGPEVFAASGKQGLEGILSKRTGSGYTQARSAAWVKVKHAQSDEFLVVGYSAPKGARNSFGALLMAVAEKGTLRYVGRVGTGYDDAALRSIFKQLQPLRQDTPSVKLPAHLPYDKRDRNGNIQWLKPQVVAEVAFRGWGKDGLLRQASFQRLRMDKDARDLGMTDSEDVRISSPERVVYKGAKVTKGAVADYYRSVADWILPQVGNRPLSLLRCPDGADGQCFFQKHHAPTLGKHVHAVPLQQKGGAEDYLYVADVAGLLELVQMNVLEFHPWGAHVDAPESPDLMVFDLDPADDVAWKEVVAAAREVRARLADTGLESWVRTTGGKGLHVVVPIAAGPDWDTVKGFTGAFAQALATQQPQRYVATMSKAKRTGRIFIDWLRNGRGATSVVSWSLRAREGAPVAMPLKWEELGRIKAGNAFDLHKATKRAASLTADPWDGFTNSRQKLPGT